MTQAQPAPARSISLAQLHIKEPCHVDWDAMTHSPGDQSKRFCSQCEKHVHNLDALTQPEIDSLFEAHQGRLCVRYTPPAAKPVPKPIMPPRPFPRRPLLTTISRIAAAILLSSSLGLSGCGRSPSPSSGSITTIERFNDWRSANAHSWVNSLMDPLFGSAPSYAIPTGVVVLGGGISPFPTQPETAAPSNTPPAKPAALGEIAAVKGDVAIRGEVYCPPPATQPAPQTQAPQPAKTITGDVDYPPVTRSAPATQPLMEARGTDNGDTIVKGKVHRPSPPNQPPATQPAPQEEILPTMGKPANPN